MRLPDNKIGCNYVGVEHTGVAIILVAVVFVSVVVDVHGGKCIDVYPKSLRFLFANKNKTNYIYNVLKVMLPTKHSSQTKLKRVVGVSSFIRTGCWLNPILTGTFFLLLISCLFFEIDCKTYQIWIVQHCFL